MDAFIRDSVRQAAANFEPNPFKQATTRLLAALADAPGAAAAESPVQPASPATLERHRPELERLLANPPGRDNPAAMRRLGELLELFDRLPECHEWYLRAAEAGDVVAQGSVDSLGLKRH
jgi:hypothetical protein